MLRNNEETGQLTLLVIGFVTIAAVLVTVGVDVSKLFLARRALSSAADAAALDAAQSVDRTTLYRDGVRCGELLPLDPDGAARAADVAAADAADDLRHAFATLDAPLTTTDGGRVTVTWHGEVVLPFRRVMALLLPGSAGRVGVDATAHAESPLTSPGGC